MTFVWIKITLAAVLAAMPFFLGFVMSQNKKRLSAFCSAQTSCDSKDTPFIRLTKAVFHLLHTLYEGMKKRDSLRRFFTLVTFLVMIGFQFVDFTASTSVSQMVVSSNKSSSDAIALFNVFGPFVTSPMATAIAAMMSLAFYSCRLSNRILAMLHCGTRLFYLTGLGALAFLFTSPRWFIVAEIMLIILIAAYVYPPKTGESQPKSRIGIPVIGHSLRIAS